MSEQAADSPVPGTEAVSEQAASVEETPVGAQVKAKCNMVMIRKLRVTIIVGFSQTAVNDLVNDLFAEEMGKGSDDLRRKRLPRQRSKALRDVERSVDHAVKVVWDQAAERSLWQLDCLLNVGARAVTALAGKPPKPGSEREDDSDDESDEELEVRA